MSKEEKTQKPAWRFVNAFLTKNEKETVKNLESSPEEFDEAIRLLASVGYKISLSFDLQNDSFIFAVTGGLSVPDVDINKCITFRHRDYAVIRSIACYVMKQGNKHSSLSQCFDPSSDDSW